MARPTKIARATFDGDTGAVAAAITSALDDSELELVSPRKVRRAIERLGFDERSRIASSRSWRRGLPDVDYRLVQPGVAFRLPIGRWLALEVSGHALLARSAGPIQRPDQYGQANIVGGDASASLDIVFGDRIALRLAGEASLLRFAFAGTGMLSTDRDGDPSTIDVRGATDRYLGGSATLAVLY